tara:strand:- start:2190 stop:2426 length:237 start_codon:yes stop_codon:yes gene_type:complete
MTVSAITKKNQPTVNKATSWLIKYNTANDLRDLADGNDDTKAFSKHNRTCEKAFDKYLEYMEELPKREQKQIEKSELY